jgi:hypothetical protein
MVSDQREVTIIGGGVASLLLGVELRRLRPDLRVRLFTQEGEQRAGGHLASWREGGYPVEHGFHALFDCYSTAKGLLSQHGLLSQFIPGPGHFFLYSDGKLAKAGSGLRSLWPPMRWPERLDGIQSTPGVLLAGMRAAQNDPAEIAALDTEDFREALRRFGAGPKVIEAPLVRLFYGVGFVGDRPLSAAVGFMLLYQLVAGGRMLHFPAPSRESLIEPLRRRFVSMGGEILMMQQLEEIELSRDGQRATSLGMFDLQSGQRRREPLGELVLALDVESCKRLRWSGAEAPTFTKKVQRLEGVVSLSLQAWFERDPVPKEIDSVLGGLPEPWSTICPVTRVRQQERGPHGFELIGCGPETGFEETPDSALIDRFFQTIERVGFEVPADRRGVHVVLRRNREPAERYLGTYPNELSLRPSPLGSGVENIYLAGAWLRVPFSIPSVEAVSQSVVMARDALCAGTIIARPQ